MRSGRPEEGGTTLAERLRKANCDVKPLQLSLLGAQASVPDDAAAQTRRPVLTAGAHRPRPIDEFGLAEELHLGRAVAAIHRAAFDKTVWVMLWPLPVSASNSLRRNRFPGRSHR